MIDFRWLDRKVQNLHPMTNVYPAYPREKVLQYRILIEAVIRTTNTNYTQVTQLQPPGKEWSPWMDVPTVKDE